MKTIVTIATALTFAATAGFAGGHNPDQARAMADSLKGNKGAASVAADVSGKDARGTSGWGNVGSSLDDGNSVSGKITAD